jgi:MFS family permease
MADSIRSDGAVGAPGPERRGLLAGPARRALAHRDFRVLLLGTSASNVGTWMQNVLLGVYGLKLTHSATYVGLLYFAQLGPLLVFSTVGGTLADIVDRRRLFLVTQLQQMVFSVVLAVAAASGNPSPALLFGCVLVIGIGNAIGAPALNAILPTLVPRESLAGAVSLQSVQNNLARVIGPPIGVGLYAATSASTVFLVNAATYLFAVAAILTAVRPRGPAARGTAGPVTRLTEGMRIAASDPLVRRVFITLVTLSFFSVSFVGLMPVIAHENLGMDPGSFEFGLLFATFGLGAALGAASVGSWLATIAPARLVRPALLAWAVLLAGFAVVRVPWAAFVIVPLLGFAYLLLMTAMSTVVQLHVDDSVRGRVLGLWFMGWGGVAPLGVLFAGALTNETSITLVMLLGAAVALALAYYTDLVRVGAPG